MTFSPSTIPILDPRHSGAPVLSKALRRRLAAPNAGGPFRVWVPECAGGEDAYAAAISLLEALRGRWREVPLCVLSTDSDERSLLLARAGEYAAEAVRGLSSEEVGRFFIRDGGRVRVRDFVKDCCRFIRHVAANEVPFANLDAIDSRGLLAELPPEERLEALRAYRASLVPGGLLLDRTGAADASPDFFSRLEDGSAYAAREFFPRAGPRRSKKEERFQALFSRMSSALLIRDLESDLILHANDAACALLGWSRAELQGMRGKALVAAPETVRRSANERRSEERLRLPHYVRKDGSAFPADAASMLIEERGRACELLLLRDATVRLRVKNERAREASDAFLGEVVHELRSPITVIRGSAEAIRLGLEEGERSQFLAFIEKNSLRLSRLVDRLLDLNAADSTRAVQPQRVKLAEAVWEIAAAFVPVAKRRGVSLTIDIPVGLAVHADPADLPHVFGNLIDNAIKFTPRGGKVRVEGGADALHGILTVRDTGAGIAPEDLSRVFERFFRSERTRGIKGTGLGLAIVQAIVKANGGRVVAENAPGGGALFRVSFPLSAP
ncbi:MAG TPA: ATP-binding protein [Elusimicrobiota bacterium]|nr:ATP-binding protein [Elusimicrobiota bacterium]